MPREDTVGVVRFLIGQGPVVAFMYDDEWNVLIRNSRIKQHEIIGLHFSRFGPMQVLSIQTERKGFRIVDFAFIDALARIADPTYDHMDETLVFTSWLRDVLSS